MGNQRNGKLFLRRIVLGVFGLLKKEGNQRNGDEMMLVVTLLLDDVSDFLRKLVLMLFGWRKK